MIFVIPQIDEKQITIKSSSYFHIAMDVSQFSRYNFKNADSPLTYASLPVNLAF